MSDAMRGPSYAKLMRSLTARGTAVRDASLKRCGAMPPPLLAITIFVAVFAIATLRNVHLGILMFPAACAVGIVLAGMPLREVVGGFPVSIMVLLAGVTYFFGIAQVNGTIDRVIGAVVTHAGARPVAMPFLFFALAGAIAAMGSPQAGLVLAPVGMPIARRSGVDPVLMAIAINSGIAAGGYAPTSLFGIVSYRVAREAGIQFSPYTLLGVAVAANFVLLVAAVLMFGRAGRGQMAIEPDAIAKALPRGFAPHHVVTLVCMMCLVASVVACAVRGIEPDIGVFAFAFGAFLTLVYPSFGTPAFARIDWSTVFAVGGIVTFVGVLQKLGAVNLLAHAAMNVGTPLLTALVICMTAGLVSAFASTTGILAALVPLAVPLATSGGVSDWGLICAMSVCAAIVDVSPVLDHRRDARGVSPGRGASARAHADDAMGHVDGGRRPGGVRGALTGPPGDIAHWRGGCLTDDMIVNMASSSHPADPSRRSRERSERLAEADSHDLIRVQGARENNLKDVSVEIPKRRLTVFTGVSGSGKSSLVFGTIAAESQRLINETYSAFVQGFLPTLGRPEVDVLEGLTTAICAIAGRPARGPSPSSGESDSVWPRLCA